MGTQTANYVCDNSSLANFKSWAQAISNAFSTFGWVQTSDTGQVNWSTIASVPSSTYVYEIWKAGDSLQSSMPIFVRVDYGFSGTSPRSQITVGTNSNGSGTITGTIINSGTATNWTYQLSNHGGTTYPCFFSGNSGNIRVYMWSQSGSAGVGSFFAIERSKDSSGNDTSSYITVCACASNAFSPGLQTVIQQTQNTTQQGPKRSGCCNASLDALSGGSTTGAANGTVAAYPVFPDFGQVGNPMLGLMVVYIADVSDGASVSVASMYGATHTYVALRDASGGLAFSDFVSRQTSGVGAMLMLYE